MPGDEPTGPSEYRDHNLIASATGRPRQSAFGEDAYKSPVEKAAALFHSLISDHPFHNGNKRTAVIALDLFLAANGWCLMMGQSDMYRLARDTASYREKNMTHGEIFRHIVTVLKGNVISFRRLRQLRGFPSLYDRLIRTRRWVRAHPLNQSQSRLP